MRERRAYFKARYEALTPEQREKRRQTARDWHKKNPGRCNILAKYRNGKRSILDPLKDCIVKRKIYLADLLEVQSTNKPIQIRQKSSMVG